MTPDPVLGQLACALDHPSDLAQADMLPKPGPQRLLDAPIAGVPLHQQSQDRPLQRASSRDFLDPGGKGSFQSRQPLGFPSVERLASNTDLLTQHTDDSIAVPMGQERADPLCIVVGCERMSLDHWFLPGGVGDLLYQPYLPGNFLATFASHTVTPVSRSFEPCLILKIEDLVSGSFFAGARRICFFDSNSICLSTSLGSTTEELLTSCFCPFVTSGFIPSGQRMRRGSGNPAFL